MMFWQELRFIIGTENKDRPFTSLCIFYYAVEGNWKQELLSLGSIGQVSIQGSSCLKSDYLIAAE
jgi:hypothetical protein